MTEDQRRIESLKLALQKADRRVDDLERALHRIAVWPYRTLGVEEIKIIAKVALR
jgi:predicted RNase H-like nuclease (RuvC/YqgF family)